MSETAEGRLSLEAPAAYCITLQGLLDPSWSDELGHMRIEHTRRTGQPAITTITGRVVDQAALSGILNFVYGLGYPLISVEYLGREENRDDSG